MASLHRFSRTTCKFTSLCIAGCRQKQGNMQLLRRYSKQTIFEKLLDLSGVYAVDLETHDKTVANNNIYEFQFETVKPEFMDDYLEATSGVNSRLHEDEAYPGKLLLSLKAVYGAQDMAVHVWCYEDGHKGINEQINYYKDNKELQEFERKTKQWCNTRSNQLCHEFSYFSGYVPRSTPEHIYELRTYALKPGSLLEWGKHWSVAINLPRKDAVAAFYSQVGDLYIVHHLWTYLDMQHRSDIRDNMWQIPGWDDCVAATVPLVRNMKNRILVPICPSN